MRREKSDVKKPRFTENDLSKMVAGIQANLTLPEGYERFAHRVLLRIEVLSWVLFGRHLHQKRLWTQDKKINRWWLREPLKRFQTSSSWMKL
uniref:Uncharacterized protein n=1 Tax=Curvibacter symbiont subsp. Hydra magnipapillata TaxID=667019 RepID=C9Y972_CURXX|nr:hypothetical protein Csp_A06730 [Curvibacter putative symbiont of Hydra magnipapillata]